MSQTLSRAMQNQQSIRIYLVYEDKPVAAMVTFEQNSIIAAMLISGTYLFTQTLLQEATILGLEPFTFELSNTLEINVSNRLERWSIR
jgi:Ni,Fe-hydrogenase I cytochrome b subunit